MAGCLAVYHAAYLELAQREDPHPVTLDRPLITAARRAVMRLLRGP